MSTKGAQRKFLSTLQPNTIFNPNFDPTTHPALSVVLRLRLRLPLTRALALALTRIEYWD